MEDLRKQFVTQFHLKGSVKIAFVDSQTVYIDFTSETDYKHIYFKPYIYFGDYPMKVLKWTPDFKPEAETTIVHVQILVNKLPWHLFRWNVLSRILESVDVAIAPNQATYSKSWGNVAKVKS